MIYKTSNSTPSSEEIDVNGVKDSTGLLSNNIFKTQINTSGEPLKAYKFLVYSRDSKDMLYESNIVELTEQLEVKNKDLLRFEVTKKLLTSNNIVNGKDYLWGIRAYNDVPGTTALPNTPVCDGYLVGSTKYVIWSKIAKTEEDTLNQLTYDRYIEIETDKTLLNLGAKPTDEERLKLKRLPAGKYRERLKIDWVEKELGKDLNYVKIETTDPFTYNYNDGTTYKIFKTSDKHTVTSAFIDPNSNVNVSDWIVIYKNMEDAQKAAEAGDTPVEIKSNIVPVFPSKKITGYSSDTGEIRVHDAWTKAPENGLVYRLFTYDTSSKVYTELFSSDLVSGAGKGVKYYPAQVPANTYYYYRHIEKGQPGPLRYYSNTSLTEGGTDLVDGESFEAELVTDGLGGYSTIKVNSLTLSDANALNAMCYKMAIPNAKAKGLAYYFDSGLTQKAGNVSSELPGDLNVSLFSNKASTIIQNGQTVYVTNNDIKYEKVKTSGGTIMFSYVNNTKDKGTKINITKVKYSTDVHKYYATYDTSTHNFGTPTTFSKEEYPCIASIDEYAYSIRVGDSVKYISKGKDSKGDKTEVETVTYLILTSLITKAEVIKYVATTRDAGTMSLPAETDVELKNSNYATVKVNGTLYNVVKPASKTITGENDFYTAHSQYNGVAKITINDVDYFVNSSDLTYKCGDEKLGNKYILQLIGGRPIYNEYFVLQNNIIEGWGKTHKRLLFILPNTNIKTDTLKNGVPNEIILERENEEGETGVNYMRVDILKLTEKDELDGKYIDITFDKLDNTQWLISGDSIAPSKDLPTTHIPKFIPLTDYRVYTSFMDTAPLNLFYARTLPDLILLCRNTYVKQTETIENFALLKDRDLTGILCYRLKPNVTYYSTIAKIGTSYYASEDLSGTPINILTNNVTVEPWKAYYTISDNAYNIDKISCRFKINDTYYYVSAPTGGDGDVDYTVGTMEYPVTRIYESPSTKSQSEKSSNTFACLIISGVEQFVPFLQLNNLLSAWDTFDKVLIHKFTSDESEYIVYTMQTRLNFLYAKATLRSESKLIYYFKPPVYNYRDMEFYTDISYESGSETIHPLIKYYRYTLYDKNGKLVGDSEDIYTTDLTWEFKGLDEGNNDDGTSSNMNSYTVNILIVDEYNREFKASKTFVVYYPIQNLTVPLSLNYDDNELAIELKMSAPLHAITSNLKEGETEYTTVTSENIYTYTEQGLTKGYVQINENDKILNYNSVYKDELTSYPVTFTDDMSIVTLFLITSDFMWKLYQQSGEYNREGKIMSFGHKHPIENHIYSSAYNSSDPTIKPEQFLLTVMSEFDYDDSSEASGKYNMLYDDDTWNVSRLYDLKNNVINRGGLSALLNKQMLELFGILLCLTGQHGLHTRDRIDITINSSTITYSTDFMDKTVVEGTEQYNVSIKSFDSNQFVEGIKLEFGYDQAYNGVYSFTFEDNKWIVNHYYTVSEASLLSSCNIVINNLQYLNERDNVTATVTGVGSDSPLVVLSNPKVANPLCSISYDSTKECPFAYNGVYNIRFFVMKDEGTVTGANIRVGRIYNIEGTLSTKTYNDFYNYGFVMTGVSVGPSIEQDFCFHTLDYIGVTLVGGPDIQPLTTSRWHIDELAKVEDFDIDATIFEQSMKKLFGNGSNIYGYYIITYHDGIWTFKLTSDERYTHDLKEYGITINTLPGGSAPKDYIDLLLRTSEKFELRIVNPEYYQTTDYGSIICNGFASCLRLYDVTDNNNPVMIPNVFLNTASGTFDNYFSIPDANPSNNYILRPNLKLAILPSGSMYIPIYSKQDYLDILNSSSGFVAGKIYVVTVEITDVSDDYHTGTLYPGLYQFDPTGTSGYSKGKLYKDPSSLYAYIASSTQFPVDEKTGKVIDVELFAPRDAYKQNGEWYDFYYSDQGLNIENEQNSTVDNMWIDLILDLNKVDIESFDKLWFMLYLVIDNECPQNSETIYDNPRIKCGIVVKQGGLM